MNNPAQPLQAGGEAEMAVMTAERIDPAEEPDIQTFNPKLPPLETVDVRKVVITYDRRSDTLIALFFGPDRPAVSVLVDDYIYVLVDPETEEVVGLQVEDFLARAVKDDPEWIESLDVAELRGITPEEVRAVRRHALGYRRRLVKALRAIRHVPQQGKRAAVSRFLDHSAPFGAISIGVHRPRV